ncbi:hypothetical protein [Streptomyces sp. NPDC091268]
MSMMHDKGRVPGGRADHREGRGQRRWNLRAAHLRLWAEIQA